MPDYKLAGLQGQVPTSQVGIKKNHISESQAITRVLNTPFLCRIMGLMGVDAACPHVLILKLLSNPRSEASI